jgi:hypothetical protein
MLLRARLGAALHAAPVAPPAPARRRPAPRGRAPPPPAAAAAPSGGEDAAAASSSSPQQAGRYAELLRGGAEAAAALKWSRATVIENREASADGSQRTLVLSIADGVRYADGRSVKHVGDHARWLASYEVPGQFLAVRYAPGGAPPEDGSVATARRLFAIASSPYESHAASSNLSASIAELLCGRGAGADADEAALAALPPGAALEVSEPLGRGFASLFNSAATLPAALEEGRPLALLAAGARGAAPARAALAWTPVQAHATARAVSLFYAAPSPAAAAYLSAWSDWRDAGVRVHPLYLGEEAGGEAGGGAGAGEAYAAAVAAALLAALFEGENGLHGALGGDPRDAAVLCAGLPGAAAAEVTKRLTHAGVASERILFADFF